MTLRLTKFLDPQDYANPELAKWVARQKEHHDRLVPLGLPAGFPSYHRYWEYGIGLIAAEIAGVTSVLEAGGGNSLFLPTLLYHFPGAAAVAVEPDAGTLAYQVRQCDGKPAAYASMADVPPGQFDLVACISVVEHVEHWEPFLAALRDRVKPGGVLYLTSDAAERQPDHYANSGCRHRIYTPDDWRALADWFLATPGQAWEYLRGCEFVWRGAHVADYSFACMALRRLA